MTTLEKSIKDYLDSLSGVWSIKTNPRAFGGRWGIPDFLVCKDGLFYAIEAKTEDDELSPRQKLELEYLQNAGALTAVVRSVDDVKRIFGSERRKVVIADNDKFAEATDRLCEAIDILCEVVNQACFLDGVTIKGTHCSDDRLDSFSFSAYADALRYLAKHGKIELLEDSGRRVIAKWKS